MIGRIHGIILEKQPPLLLIDVNGIAYEVHASMNTFYKLPETGEKIIMHTHLIVREDAHILYGFFDKEERRLFRALIKVNSVGPKLALTILSSVSPHEFTQFVAHNNTQALVKLPGVGKKTAERLLIEMRDKLADIEFSGVVDQEQFQLDASSCQPSAEQEAISALIALGYKPQEASRAIAKIETQGLNSEAIIRLSLKNMVVKTQ